MPSGTHDAVEDPRNADVLIWVSGALVPRVRASISVFDSGYLVGDGIWEGMRLFDGVLLHLEDHLARLQNGLETLRIPDRPTADWAKLLYRVLEANGMWDGVHVRLMVTRGLKKTPSQDPRLTISGPHVVVIAEYKSARPQAEGITLHTSSVRRPPPDTLDQRLNCHSKIHEVMALNEALEVGADEALMLDTNGHVATCNATNFFAVVDGELWTSTGQHCLPGITRSRLLEIAPWAGLTARALDFTRTQLDAASEAFVTGTFGGLTPVRAIDGRALQIGGPVTKALRQAYREDITRYVSSASHGISRPSDERS